MTINDLTKEMHEGFIQVKQEIANVNNRIDNIEKGLNAKIDDLEQWVDIRFNKIEHRLDIIENDIIFIKNVTKHSTFLNKIILNSMI